MKRALAITVLSASICGCATITGWFNDTKKENIEPPTPLALDFVPTLNVQKVWGERVGKGAQGSGALLQPAYADGKLYAVSLNGEIAALDANSGHSVWTKKSDFRYSGSPSINGDLLVVGTVKGEVQALSSKDGSERWKSQVSSEVISAPAIGDGIVAVRSHDGHIFGLDEADGTRKWTFDHSAVPILSLRGNSAPVIVSGAVFCGEDNGKVTALRVSDGGTLWEQQLAGGEGRTEIERLQDVDGQIVVDAGVVYAAGYRGQVGALVAQTGRPLWTHEMSSYTGTAVSASQIYVANADSQILALDIRSGTSEWKQDALKYRWVSELAVQGDYVVFGDIEGFVHWLAISDGKIVARQRLSKNPIRAAPVVAGDVAYVTDVDGEIGAYRIGK